MDPTASTALRSRAPRRDAFARRVSYSPAQPRQAILLLLVIGPYRFTCARFSERTLNSSQPRTLASTHSPPIIALFVSAQLNSGLNRCHRAQKSQLEPGKAGLNQPTTLLD